MTRTSELRRLPATTTRALALMLCVGLVAASALPALAGGLSCRKVVAKEASGEGRNTAAGSRVRCAQGEVLTGGTCYAEVRPEDDGSCQTSAMGIIQTIADHPDSTEAAFFTCMQTGGSDCAVQERTRAMAICCKMGGGAE